MFHTSGLRFLESMNQHWRVITKVHSFLHSWCKQLFFNFWYSSCPNIYILRYISLLLLSWLSHVWLFCNPMDRSLPGSSAHGISKVRILEWVAISFSRGSFQPRDQTCVSCLAGGFFTTEPPGKSQGTHYFIRVYFIYSFLIVKALHWFFPMKLGCVYEFISG